MNKTNALKKPFNNKKSKKYFHNKDHNRFSKTKLSVGTHDCDQFHRKIFTPKSSSVAYFQAILALVEADFKTVKNQKFWDIHTRFFQCK